MFLTSGNQNCRNKKIIIQSFDSMNVKIFIQALLGGMRI